MYKKTAAYKRLRIKNHIDMDTGNKYFAVKLRRNMWIYLVSYCAV
ncbi:MAG: hypothetical protein OSJ62_15745 [Lachnospiraceae bacterium]|nr:hypothetical protein [Lachnospiraceae bacterium]